MKSLYTLLLITLLSGCSSLRLALNPHPYEALQQAIAQQHFKQAQRIVEGVAESDPDYEAIQALRPTLKQARDEYIRKQLSDADDLADQDQWQAAIEQLKTTQTHLPPPTEKIDARIVSLLDEQQQHTWRQLEKLLRGEARWLLRAKPQIAYLSRQQQDQEARQLAEHLEQRQPRLAQQLITLGAHFFDQQRWWLSARCLELAKKLGRDIPDDLFDQAMEQIQQAQQLHQNQQQQRLQQEAEQRLAAYRESGHIGDLLAARDYILTHNEDRLLERQLQQLHQLSQARFREDIELGDQLYAKGQYKKAQQLWQQLAPLDPDNRALKEKLTRVAKVLDSLKKLKE